MPSQPEPAPSVAHSLREAACLAHAVPGVTLRLHCHSGAELLVSYSCLGADLDPCRLRATIVHAQHRGAERLAAGVVRIELVAGLRPLGAGLYQRRHAGVNERWLVTTLAPGQAAAALAGGPDHVHTTIKPDPELGVHAVCLRPIDGAGGTPGELDEAAVWALSALMTEELTAELRLLPTSTQQPLRRPTYQPLPRKDVP